MAVEKVVMMNVVGKLRDVDRFAQDIFLFNDIQLIDAMGEIDSGRFTLPVAESNIEELLGFASLTPGSNPQLKKIYQQKLTRLEEVYQDKLKFDPKRVKGVTLNEEKILADTDAFINRYQEEQDTIENLRDELEKIKLSRRAYDFLTDIDVPMGELFDMKYFTVDFGSLTKDNAERFKTIYPSITSIVFHVGNTVSGEEAFLVITENHFKVETERVLKALGFKPMTGLNPSYTKTPQEILADLAQKQKQIESSLEVEEAKYRTMLQNSGTEVNELYNQLYMLATINTMKGYMAFSQNNFYFAAWIPVRKEEEARQIVGEFKDMTILFQKAQAGERPPTKLKNNWLFRPFEELVKMYGVPNYNELDPTPFLSLTYMFCFGFMFGDVGQGLILLLGGLLMEKKGNLLGGILARIAVSSIIFGFIYGSVFGNETLLPALWLRPMEDTNTLLITAVCFGVGMLIVAYIYGIINKMRQHQVETGYFGKNGISGFILYITILFTALGVMNYIPIGEHLIAAGIMIIVGLTILIYLQGPVTNLVEKKKFSHDINGEYYVSSFFECFEMYLSMLSNTLSFIRVGAFALTHAGMFMAFETLAEMAGGGIAGTIIMVIGNIFIIILEGLIDVIQCLRLEFYELFGKYYEGDGTEFVPVREEIEEAEASRSF